jgi:serine/threonine-protein kinase RsbW
MTGDRVSYTLESTLESVNRAEQAAERFAAQFGLPEDDLQGFAMAVREATINAVLHGNAYDPHKTVQVTFVCQAGELEVTVRDQGKGFDIASVPDPLAPENLLKQSGRGIFLIRNYMDEVHFRNLNPGTEMVLIKRVRGQSADDKEKGKS